jgi:hypothetical protein
MLVCRVEELHPRDQFSPERAADNYAADLLMPRNIFQPIARSYAKLNFKRVKAIADVFDTSWTATAIRLVESGHSPAILVCHNCEGRKWFSRGPAVSSRWFPKAELDPDSFAFGILFAGKSDDAALRKIGADAWFDRRDAERFEVQEQTIRTGPDEILSLVLMTDDEMLCD